jgi:putative methionine-R-sulfoxide reductase with GAF domain
MTRSARAANQVQDLALGAAGRNAFDSTRSEMIVLVSGSPSGEVVDLIDVESERVGAFGKGGRRRLEDCASLPAAFWADRSASPGG